MSEYYYVISAKKRRKPLFGKNKGESKPASIKVDGPYGMTEELAYWLASKNGEDGCLTYVYSCENPNGNDVLERFCNGELRDEKSLIAVSVPQWAATEELIMSEVV